MPDVKPRVLIIVVAFNGMEWMDRCLCSVNMQNDNASLEIDTIVVDNGSTDGTIEFIRSGFPDVELIVSEKNLGFGTANNIGFKKAVKEGYDYVYLLNQDAWIMEDTLPRLLEISRKYPEYGILSPVQLSGDGKTPDSAFRKACGAVFDTVSDGGKSVTETADYSPVNQEVVDVPFSMAAHWLIPLKALEKTGGFSPTFFHYGEDNNLIHRMKWHGFKIGVVPSARAIHDRLDRPVSRKKDLYLKDISNLIRLSDPRRNMFANVCLGWFYALSFSIKNMTLSPMRGIIRQMKRITEISSNQRRSRLPGAFL